MKKKINWSLLLSFTFFLGCFSLPVTAQELNATVVVRHQKVRGVASSVFQQMESSIQDFINSRQWTQTAYKSSERIDCRFLIDLQQEDNHVYKALLTVQSSRPVYNSSYYSPLLNFKDQNVAFKFEPYTPIIFNKNRVTGNDPQVSNLSAILAYYAYIIIGLDQDSFSQNGGHDAFKTAQSIVNDAPDGRQISGWKSFDGTINRYWLTENLLNVRYQKIHQVFYDYHRKGLDKMYDNAVEGREAILQAVTQLNALNADNPSLMILKVFFAAKNEELANIFAKGSGQERLTALNLLQKLDPSHSSLYRKSMKQ